MRRNSRHQFTSQERSLGGRHSAEHMQRDRYGHFTSGGEEDRGRSGSQSRSRSGGSSGGGGGRSNDRYSTDRNSSRGQSRMPMRDSHEYDSRYQNDRSNSRSSRDSRPTRDRWAEETDPRSWAYRSPRIRQDDDEREHESDRGYGSRSSSRNDRDDRDVRDFGDSNARQGRYNSYREDDARGRFDDNEDNENFYDADEFEQRDTRDRTLSAEHEDEDYEDRDIDDEDRGDLDTRSFSITGPDDVEDMDNRRIRGLRNEYADENRSSYWQNDWNDRQDQRGSRSRRDERPEFDDRVSDRNLEREYNRGPNSMRNEYAGSSQNQYHGYRARGHGGHGGYRNQ